MRNVDIVQAVKSLTVRLWWLCTDDGVLITSSQ